MPSGDCAVLQTDVVLFARVLHDHIGRRLQIPCAGVHPVMCVRLRVMNSEGVLNGARVRAQVCVDEFGILAVRMAVGIESRVAVEASGLDNQRISVPMRGGNAVPAGRKVLGPLEIRIH